MTRSFDSIKSSDSFIALYTKGYAEDRNCAFELGTAILLGKPIGLLIEEGEKIPRNLTLIASSIQYFKRSDEADCEQAIKRITSDLNRLGAGS